MKTRRNNNKKNKESDMQSIPSNDIIDEFQIEEIASQNKFNLDVLLSKNQCTSYSFGKTPIDQKAYICLVCDKKGTDLMCQFCHKFCHEKCRGTLVQDPKLIAKKERLNYQKFACHCGLITKHTFDLNSKKNKKNCNMMQLDQELGIIPYHCISHDVIVCCICAVVCHKNCTVTPELEANSVLTCNCISDFHSNFNEMALNFPLEKYKELSKLDVWPIQILNILFSTGKIFDKMKQFFEKIFSNEIDIKTQNKLVVNKFADLLELFANTFNKKFKTYYYHEEITNMFPYQKLFLYIQNLEVNDGPSCIIKFRLLFILLYIHLKKDFQVFKSLSSNDFVCNNVLQRLLLKKLFQNDNIFTTNINEKYKILEGNVIKQFAIKEICKLISQGMNYISMEENQDEFEIGLKIICFMLKRLMLDKENLIVLIDSLYNFHEKFYEYIMSSKKNIYSLIDIFNGIIEICFMICVSYNDLIIEENLYNNQKEFKEKFMITKSEHSNKLLIIVIKNCDIFCKHFDLLIKPELDVKSKEEKKREEKLRKHLLSMQQNILSKTTGLSNKMPENGGLFWNKIINMFNETLSMFALTDNTYLKGLGSITEEDIKEFNNFNDKIKDNDFYNIMRIYNGKEHSNILLNLKVVIEEVYFNLFTTSYVQQEEELEKKLRTRILNAFDEIKKNIEEISNNSYFSKFLNKFKENEKKLKKENENNESLYLDEEELIKRKILKDISVNINFAKNPFLLIQEGRELIVDNLIVSQIDETLFKGLIFLTNIHFPNIITPELVRLYMHFLGLFLLTKRGVKYILMGKNMKNIHRLLNRFRYDGKNKNLVENKGRSTSFNVNSIKVVIHYLCLISKFIKLYNIKTILNHKVLPNYQKSLIIHLKYYANNLDNEDAQIEFKQQLKESLEIFNNLFEFYTYNEFEYIKFDFIDIFKNCPLKLLNPEFFQKWFDRTTIDFEDPVFKKRRKWDLAFYFQFLELISKNTFYVYNNDVYGKKLIGWLKVFIDIENFTHIMNTSNDLISFTQRTTLLNFFRTYYLIDYLDQTNYLKKTHLLTTGQYKLMIKNDILKDKNVTQYLVDFQDKNNDKYKSKKLNSKKAKIYSSKLDYINEVIFLIQLYSNELEKFPNSIFKESDKSIKNYMIELIFATHDISTIIYASKNIINKILPYYYRLIINFFKKKSTILEIFKDIENNKKIIDPKDYDYLLEEKNINEDYEFCINRSFNIFDIDYIYKNIIKTIFDIYKKTKINHEVNLERYLKIYDLYNETNFPPFSLLEVKDYEYFYEENDNEKKNNKMDKTYQKFKLILSEFIAQYKDITSTSFLGILSGEATNKKIDFSAKYVNLFKSFINSTESANLASYRILLCIMVKLLLYDNKHIQYLFKDLSYDRYFFKNLNRELNYHIVQSINSAKKYELFFGIIKITEITKLTIQFIQLLGEGFNLDFHDNILRGIIKAKKGVKRKAVKKEKKKNDKKGKKKKKKKEENEESKNNEDNEDENEEKENEDISIEESESDSINFEINEEIIQKAIDLTVKNELNKKRVVPLVETQSTIYETMIFNLRIIYHLMNLNLLVEGELAFDKLCTLSSNIIDFIIEFIDTKGELTYIIDYYMKSLFFGIDKDNNKFPGYSSINKKGIYSIFTLKIKDDKDEDSDQDDNQKSYNKYKLRKTMIGYMKIKYYQLLQAYLQIGNKDDFAHIMVEFHLGPFQLFGEILYYMRELINNLVHNNYEKYKNLLEIEDANSYITKLNNLYIFDEEFRTSMEMSVIFKICIIILTLEEFYKEKMLKDYFKKEKEKEIENNANNNNNEEEDLNSNSTKDSKEEDNNEEDLKDEIKTNKTKVPLSPNKNIKFYYHPDNLRSDNNLLDNFETNEVNPKDYNYSPNEAVFQEINDTPYSHLEENYKKRKNKEIKEEKEKKERLSKKKKTKLSEEEVYSDKNFIKAIYYFLTSLISKVEIRMVSTEETSHKIDIERENNFKFISGQISKKLINLPLKNKRLSIIKIDDKNENEKINLHVEMESNANKISFFIRPHYSFHLSKQTKLYFIKNVDRTHVYNKYSSLVSFADYCIFEMIYNMRYINKTMIKKKLSQMSLYYYQAVNYCLALLENAFLIYHYYRKTSLSKDEYENEDKTSLMNKRFIDIFIIMIIKFVLIAFVLLVWFYSKYIITYQRNIICSGKGNFIFRKRGSSDQNINKQAIINFFRYDGSLLDAMGLINKDISFCNKFKIVLIDSILANGEINTFIFSLVLNILFILFGHPIILSLELILVIGIFPSLYNICRAITMKIISLGSCLLLLFFIVYIYNWISILELNKLFIFDNVFDYKIGEYTSESFCQSSVQCLLIMYSYGRRSGGGIGDILPVMSYKNKTNIFILRFFYDITFYIFIIMIMGNITVGLIVDTFGVLRDETYKNLNDINNVCFICQLNRDDCLLKNIDFDNHIKNEHNIWNYVDFLCHLHLYDSNNLSRVESFVWDKLIEKDYGWIPIDSDATKDDEEGD